MKKSTLALGTMATAILPMGTMALAPAAGAYSAQFYGVQFNICSWKCTPTSSGGGGQNSDSTNTNFGINPTNEIWAVIAYQRFPRFISLNEVCTRGFNNLANTLAPYGYSGYLYQAKGGLTSSAGGCQSFGNAVFFKGSGPGAFFFNAGPQDPNSTEVRGGICAPSAGDGGDLWACSTHLATPVAAQQASAIRGGLDAWLNNQAGRSNNVLAGDFNATPGSAATGAMTNYTDMISGVAVTYETNSNHIDYIWAHVPNLAGPDAMGNVPPWSYSASDHRQIWGSMHIK